jgi:putative selenate reductase
MSEIMTPISFESLVKWMLKEYHTSDSVFGLPQSKFYRNQSNNSVSLLGETLSSPAGAAAGPNTQLAQNILAAYLGGLKFIELKTVQIMDGEELRACIARPCIKAEKEGYNCEWSTELTVEQAQNEYIKAWFLLQVARVEFDIAAKKDFLFNMSVGYDFNGIITEKIDGFIETMKDAEGNETYTECFDYLFSNMSLFENFAHNDLVDISANICTSITLSTLHGCPPEEIEKIASYFIDKKDIHTYIKLNPTLLGFDFTRKTLDDMGYTNVDFDNTHFEQDLKYDDAVPMIKRLKKLADKKDLTFGVKITNTFPVKSNGQLPSESMYMSGQALYPLSINVASNIATEFKGNIPISYSGGADFYNIEKIFGTGIKPITIATTILKPGGYARSNQISTAAQKVTDHDKVDYKKLEKLAKDVVKDTKYLRQRPERAKIPNTLPLFDCGTPSCSTNGCPINQQVPSYLSLLASKQVDKAFEVVVNDNVLPSITGKICPHECQSNCVRTFYDSSVAIRQAKNIIATNAQGAYIDAYKKKKLKSKKKVCIVGAGPAGVSLASYLARNGVDVTVFEKEDAPMGVVKSIIPAFRIPDSLINIDFELSKKYGAKYEFGNKIDMNAQKLKAEYDFVVLAFGALMPGFNPLKEGKENIIDALEFLKDAKYSSKDYGKNVGIIGGGDVAMDTARAAKHSGAKNSYILYRRTEEFMPASEEEINAAKQDGIEFKELLSPIAYDGKTVTLDVMKLSDFGSDGRRKVVSTGKQVEMILDTLISATGSNVDKSVFEANGFETTEKGLAKLSDSFETSIKDVYVSGDCAYGAKTIVDAMANSKAIAIDILEKLHIQPDFVEFDDGFDTQELYDRKGVLFDAENAKMHKCLGCNTICELCVDVCPNRSNIAITMDDGSIQILHMDGMCNECGNCAGFCPHGGDPYKDKFTVFWSLEDFIDSKNTGFFINEKAEFIIRHPKVKFQDREYVLGEKGVPRDVWAVIKRYLSHYSYTWVK